MATTILVLGATGNVGQHVVAELSKRGGDKVVIRAATRDPAKATQWKDLRNVTPVQVDVTKIETVEAAIKGADKLFLVVSGQVLTALEETRKIADLAKKYDIKHVVKLSAYHIDDKPGYVLGRAHLAAEEYIRSQGLTLTSLRPSSFNSNITNLYAYTIKTQGAFYDASGNRKLNRVDNRDIGAVAAVVLLEPGHEDKNYEVLGPDNITQDELAKIISSAIGKEVKYVNTGDEGVRDYLTKAGMPSQAVEAMVDLYAYFRKGGYDVPYNGLVEQLTGRKPYSVEQFIKENIAAFKD